MPMRMNRNSFKSNISAKEKALRLLDRFDYSEKGLYDKLCERFPPKEAAAAVAYCVEKNYVNDYRYGKVLWDRYSQKYGVRRVYFELIKRGIPKETASKIMLEEDAPQKEEVVLQIVELIVKKQKNIPVDKDNKNKVISYLVRRGFGLDDIYNAIDDYNNSIENDQW